MLCLKMGTLKWYEARLVFQHPAYLSGLWNSIYQMNTDAKNEI